ncbi:MAG: arginine--tRNA ligase [Candidatus Nitrosopelagicus sp.]
MVLLNIINHMRENISKIILEKGYGEVNFVVEPSRSGFGDIACNVAFLLAQSLKKTPKEIAQEFVGAYDTSLSKEIDKVEAHQSGYLNFFLDAHSFNKAVLLESQKENYGNIDIGKNSKLIVEHTSVNPNKALHIGHLRNVVIGDAISRILSKVNYDVKVLNYIDDSGLQVADLIVGFKFGGFSETPLAGEKFANYCGDTVYVKTTAKYESDKELESRRREILKELEDPTSETAKFGKIITRKVLKDQLDTVWNLGASYDCLNFESQILHSKLWEKIFERMKSENLVRLEDEGDNSGCWILPIENEDDKILVRSNGVATYVAKDIPYAAWKLGILDDPFNYVEYTSQQVHSLHETTLGKSMLTGLSFAADKVITVIDNRQTNLQKIVTNLMSKFKPESSYVHLGYEAVTLSAETANLLGNKTDGKDVQMSGRKGLYINADEIIEKLEKRIYLESKERNSSLDDASLNEIAHDVAIGTIRYELIKPDLDKIITFDINTSLKLEGDTCSYIQYSCVRAARILEKSDKKPDFNASFDQLNTQHDLNLIKQIGMFEIFVNDAAKNYSPKVIAKYCYGLAVTFSSFYEHVKVLKAETPELVNARLCLVLSFGLTLEKALDLLGITVPQRM